jgi:ABC-type oligopeptide transport system substrate-binding subunit/ABC-type branched-subunit amino acid transport system substrate-binding protein
MPILKRYSILLAITLLISACGGDPVAKRTASAKKSDELKKDIVIGIVASSDTPDLFLEGVKLAVDQLNAEEYIAGRKISPVFYDDKGEPEKALEIAESLAANPDVVAVIGHLYDRNAIPASITYEENGIVFISPGASDPSLTQHGGVFTFRNISSDEESGRELANLAFYKELKKIIVLYDRDNSSGKRFSEIFSKRANELGIEIVATKSYFGWQQDIPLFLSDIIKKYEFDAVFLAGELPSAAEIIKLFRDMGKNVPILSDDALDSPELSVIAGKAAEGTLISSAFDPRQSTSRTQTFLENFKAAFGVFPDTWSALGYDAIEVLAYSIKKSDSTVPIAISTALRGLENWHGVPGHYSFTRNGDIKGKEIYFKEMQGGEFQFVESGFKKEKERFDLVKSVTLSLPLNRPVSIIDPGLLSDSSSVEIADQLFLGLTDLDPQTSEAVPELAAKPDPAKDPKSAAGDASAGTPQTQPPDSAETDSPAAGGNETGKESGNETQKTSEWTVSEDGMTYRFHLRKDVAWTDGSPVTAHDIVWAVRRNILPETKSPAAHLLYFLKNAEEIHTGKIEKLSEEIKLSLSGTGEKAVRAKNGGEAKNETFGIQDALPLLGVKAVDDFTVEFNLIHPCAFFPVIAGLPVYRPLPRKAVEKYGEKWTEPENIQTNGPFTLVNCEKNSRIILRRNPKYFNAQNVAIREVRYHVIRKNSVALKMYENDELDIIGGTYLPIPSEELSRVQTEPALRKQYSEQPKLCTEAYFFNTLRPPTDNPLVRKAISAVVDREFLAKFILRGHGKPATAFAAPPAFGSDPGGNIGIMFNPVAAKEWLAQAGYPDGKGFPEMTLRYDPQSELGSETARAIQAFLKNYLNIKVLLEGKESPSPQDDPNTLPHLFRYRQCGDYPDADGWLYRISQSQFFPGETGQSELSFAGLTKTARESSDPKERRRLYQRAEQILLQEEAVILPIYFESAGCLVKHRVKGWYYMAVGGQHICNWRIEE